MPEQLHRPHDSKLATLLLNRIIALDEPYLSRLAEAVGKQAGSIQPHITAMAERGWLDKESQGRKTVYSVNPQAIWQDSHQLHKLSRQGWDDIPDEIQDFLLLALRSKISFAVIEVTSTDPGESDDGETLWIQGTDVADADKPRVWFGTETTVKDILAAISSTVMTFEAAMQEIGRDDLSHLQTVYADEAAYTKSYIKLVTGEWDEADMADFLNDVLENPYDDL